MQGLDLSGVMWGDLEDPVLRQADHTMGVL